MDSVCTRMSALTSAMDTVKVEVKVENDSTKGEETGAKGGGEADSILINSEDEDAGGGGVDSLLPGESKGVDDGKDNDREGTHDKQKRQRQPAQGQQQHAQQASARKQQRQQSGSSRQFTQVWAGLKSRHTLCERISAHVGVCAHT